VLNKGTHHYHKDFNNQKLVFLTKCIYTYLYEDGSREDVIGGIYSKNDKCSAESPKRKRALGILTWEHKTKIYLEKKSMADNILVRAWVSGALKYNTHCGSNVSSDCAKYRYFHD
jgi:hypothetical protein